MLTFSAQVGKSAKPAVSCLTLTSVLRLLTLQVGIDTC